MPLIWLAALLDRATLTEWVADREEGNNDDTIE
jgi:hypothetical protein